MSPLDLGKRLGSSVISSACSVMSEARSPRVRNCNEWTRPRPQIRNGKRCSIMKPTAGKRNPIKSDKGRRPLSLIINCKVHACQSATSSSNSAKTYRARKAFRRRLPVPPLIRSIKALGVSKPEVQIRDASVPNAWSISSWPQVGKKANDVLNASTLLWPVRKYPKEVALKTFKMVSKHIAPQTNRFLPSL